jgi:hypothetical protein
MFLIFIDFDSFSDQRQGIRAGPTDESLKAAGESQTERASD